MNKQKYIKFHKNKKAYKSQFIVSAYRLSLKTRQVMGCVSYLQGNQLEAVRRTIVRQLLKTGKVVVRVKPTLAVFKKATGSRMGKGKGKIKSHTAYGKPGTQIISVRHLSDPLIKKSLRVSMKKLPFKAVIS